MKKYVKTEYKCKTIERISNTCFYMQNDQFTSKKDAYECILGREIKRSKQNQC